MVHYLLAQRAQARKSQRLNPPSPSPARSESSDTPMIDYDLLAEKVSERLAPRFDASDKARDEQFKQLSAQYTQLKKDYNRLQSAHDDLKGRVVFLETVCEHRDQTDRISNAMIFNVPEEDAGARPIDSVKQILDKLPADGTRVDPPVACVRIGVPRAGSTAKPRPIKATFVSTDAMHSLLKRGKDLRAKGYGVDLDLTPKQRQERISQRDRYMALKTQGLTPFWRGSKLMYRQGNRTVLDTGNPPPPPPGNPPTYAQAVAAPAPGSAPGSAPAPARASGSNE